MKKVLFLGRFPPPVHGAALMNENYFQELKKDKDIQIKRIKINYSDSLEELGKINLKKFFGFFIAFFKTLQNLLFFRPEIVYFELAPRGFAFYRDSVYVLLCKLFGRKLLFHFHAKGISSRKSKFSKAYIRFILRKSKVILLSNLLYYDIKEFVKKQDVFIIPNAIKDELTEKKFKEIIKKRKKNKEIRLLFLSNMIESKGPLDVLKICSKLKEKKIKFICNFVGAFSDEEFKKKFFNTLDELGLKENCFYLGPKYGKEKFKILETTNYMLFPTSYKNEVFPLVVLEALMYGVPVFGYENGAMREIVSVKSLGAVVKQGDWEALSKELIQKIRENLSPDTIRQKFKKKYLLERSTKKLIEVIHG